MDVACAEAMGWELVERFHNDAVTYVAFADNSNPKRPRPITVVFAGNRRGSIKPWRPAARIEHAWELVEALGEHHLPCVYIYHQEWVCEIDVLYVDPDEALTFGYGDSAPLAICRAFLKSRGVTEVECAPAE